VQKIVHSQWASRTMPNYSNSYKTVWSEKGKMKAHEIENLVRFFALLYRINRRTIQNKVSDDSKK
jgi:hypothetical protein